MKLKRDVQKWLFWKIFIFFFNFDPELTKLRRIIWKKDSKQFMKKSNEVMMKRKTVRKKLGEKEEALNGEREFCLKFF